MSSPTVSRPQPTAALQEAPSAKTRRAFALAWGQLTNPRSFCVPLTIAEHESVSIFDPHVTHDRRRWFLRPAARKTLRNVVDRLYDTPGFKNTLAYDSIYREVLAAIEMGLDVRLAKHPIDGATALGEILGGLEKRRDHHETIFLVDGLSLEDLSEVPLGLVTLFKFGPAERAAILGPPKGTAFERDFSTFLSKTFENQVCARIVVYGDPDTARQRARTAARHSINFLRFGLCFLAPGAGVRNQVNITLRESSNVRNDVSLTVAVGANRPAIHWGRGNVPLEPVILTPHLLEQFRERLYLGDLCEILAEAGYANIDGPIRNALYWIGEAQSDANSTTAFVKYWMSIEALITGDAEEISERLGKAVAVLLAFSGYAFITPAEIPSTRSRLKRLYGRRCRIVHAGMCEEVGAGDLQAMCEYAARTLISVLALRSDGLRDREKLQAEVNRLSRVAGLQL